MSDHKIPAKLKAVIPIVNYSSLEPNGIEIYLNDLKQSSGKIPFKLPYLEEIMIEITTCSKVDNFEVKENHDLYIIFESEFNFDPFEIASKSEMSFEDKSFLAPLEKNIPEELKGSFNALNKSPEVLLIPSILALYFSNSLKQFLMLSQIAHPGTLWTADGAVYFNQSKSRTISGFTSILSERGFYDKKWPILTQVTVETVWKYANTKTRILTDFSETNIERAINAFTYIFSTHYLNNIPTTMFWSISGLETLYVRGETGITQQLNDKLQIFLGVITSNKKQVKKLYSYRSSLIHGSMNTPINDGIMNEDPHVDELLEMACFSANILVASLQKIISEDRTTFEFDYKLKNEPNRVDGREP